MKCMMGEINRDTYSIDADKSKGSMPYGEMDYAEEKNMEKSKRDKEDLKYEEKDMD